MPKLTHKMYQYIVFLILAFFTPWISLASQTDDIDAYQQKQFRLHFDVNKTIIAMDPIKGKGLEETLNGILAEFTFEKWDGKNEQSYYTYITDNLVAQNPNISRADELLKNKRAELLKEFPAFLKQHPVLLEQYEQDKARMLNILNREDMVIFPSFFKAITWLNDCFPSKFAIYLRTFGQDLPDVIPAIEKATELKFAGQGKFQGKKLFLGHRKEKNLYDFFVGANVKHYAIRDDYAYWKSSGFQTAGGKPFPLETDDGGIISIFFDDNADDLDKPIICPISANNVLESTQELLKKGNIVSVNPKEAILDEDYFIKKIQALLL